MPVDDALRTSIFMLRLQTLGPVAKKVVAGEDLDYGSVLDSRMDALGLSPASERDGSQGAGWELHEISVDSRAPISTISLEYWGKTVGDPPLQSLFSCLQDVSEVFALSTLHSVELTVRDWPQGLDLVGAHGLYWAEATAGASKSAGVLDVAGALTREEWERFTGMMQLNAGSLFTSPNEPTSWQGPSGVSLPVSLPSLSLRLVGLVFDHAMRILSGLDRASNASVVLRLSDLQSSSSSN